MKNILFFSLFILTSFPALGQEADRPDLTRIEVDQDAHVVRIFVQGEEVAQFSSVGLIVPGTVAIGDAIKDVGHAGAKDLMNASRPTDAQDDGSE